MALWSPSHVESITLQMGESAHTGTLYTHLVFGQQGSREPVGKGASYKNSSTAERQEEKTPWKNKAQRKIEGWYFYFKKENCLALSDPASVGGPWAVVSRCKAQVQRQWDEKETGAKCEVVTKARMSPKDASDPQRRHQREELAPWKIK